MLSCWIFLEMHLWTQMHKSLCKKNIINTHNEYILEQNEYLSCTSEVPQWVYEAIGSQSVEMGFIFFLLSLTPLVPCGLRTQFCCICSFFDYHEESSVLCQTSLKWDAIWLLLYRPALTMPPVSPYKGLPCYRRLDETKFKRLKTGQKITMYRHVYTKTWKIEHFHYISFVKQAWVNAEQAMTVLFGFKIWNFQNTLQYTAVSYILFWKWYASLSISVVLSRLAYEILLVGFKWNISKTPRGGPAYQDVFFW